MDLYPEVISIIAVLIPAVLSTIALLVQWRFAQAYGIKPRVFTLIFTSLCTVLVIGTGLSGLTRPCFSSPPVCNESEHLSPAFGNFLSEPRSCEVCVPNGLSGEIDGYRLNQMRPLVIISTAFYALLLSSVNILIFGMWARTRNGFGTKS